MALVTADKTDLKEVAACSVAAKNAGFPVDTAATASVIGSVLKAATVASPTTGTDTVTQAAVVAILVSLKAAGIMA